MILSLDLSSTTHVIRYIHVIITATFIVNAIWLIIRSFLGVIKDKPFLGIDKFLSYAFIINLYFQLIFGFILFANLATPMGYDYLNADGAVKTISSRLWPIEHIILMLFALFISNLGLILSHKSQTGKHKKILIYYSVSILLIIISLSAVNLH